MKRFISNKYAPYIILFIGVGSNLVFFFDQILISDDLFDFWYSREKGTNLYNPLIRGPFYHYFRFFYLELFNTHYILPKALLVCFGIISSFGLYYFYFKTLNLGRKIALVSALIPFLLPGQTGIFFFHLGSYSLVGFTFFILSVIMSQKYLEKSNLKNLIVCIIFLYLSKNMFGEYFLILSCLFVLINLFINKINLHSYMVSGLYGFFGLWYLFRNYLRSNNSYNSVHNQDFDTILVRIETIFSDYLSPFPINQKFGVIVLLILIFLTSYVLFIYLSKNQDESRKNAARASLIGIMIYIMCSVPFLLSKQIESRYLFIASFGYCLFLITSLYLLSEKYHHLASKISVYGISGILVLGLFSLKYKHCNDFYFNTIQIGKDISTLKVKNNIKNPQYIILIDENFDSKKQFSGHIARSRGFLRLAMKRNDVDGLIGTYSDTLQPFIKEQPKDIWNLSYMTGLDINKSLFIYRYKSNKFQKIDFVIKYDIQSKKYTLSEINQKGKIIFKSNLNREFLENIKHKTDNFQNGNYIKINT